MHRGWISGTALAIAAAVGVGIGFAKGQPDRVVCLSVGQGDCTLVESQGRAILIDVGPASEQSDAAQKIILPRLEQLGVQRVDEIWLSHPDRDHVGGLKTVLLRFPAAQVYLSSAFKASSKMITTLQEARVPARQVHWISAATGQLGVFKFRLLTHPWHPPEDDNLGSMFVKLEDRGATFVTTGDGPAQEEVDELPVGDWQAEVLHLGHHGSRYSSSIAWLKAVHPRYAVASCGRNNRYHHPNPDTVERVHEMGIELHRTDREQDIEFDDEAGEFRLKR